VRSLLVPEKAVHLTRKSSQAATDFLSDELRAGSRKSGDFSLEGALVSPGDQTKDGSQPGLMTQGRRAPRADADKVVPNSLDAEKSCCSAHDSPGIELSDDPLPSVALRYAVVVRERSQPSSAIRARTT